jgi:dihydrofolate reductase
MVRGHDPGADTVPSRLRSDPQWADTTVLSGDLAAVIGELKAKPASELQVHGSGALTRWLLANDLVDEMNLLVCPVIVGQGMRLFPAAGPDIALDLVESRALGRVHRPQRRVLRHRGDRPARRARLNPGQPRSCTAGSCGR